MLIKLQLLGATLIMVSFLVLAIWHGTNEPKEDYPIIKVPPLPAIKDPQ